MRDHEELRFPMTDGERRTREAAAHAVKSADACSSALVDGLRETWVRPHLLRDHEGGRPPQPEFPIAKLGPAIAADLSRDAAIQCVKLFAARALAHELLATQPSWRVLRRARQLLHHVSWTEFLETVAASANSPVAHAWASTLAEVAEPEDYAVRSSDRERAAYRQASERWRAMPRVLCHGPDRTHAPLDSSYSVGMQMLRHLDPVSWFKGLRNARVRSEVELAVFSASQRPDALLDLLSRAPVAVDREGNETGDVAAILLARRAWSYVIGVAETLAGRARSGEREAAALAAADVRAFHETEIEPWLNAVWTVIEARSDGPELGLALAVEQIAERTRRDGEPSAVASLVAVHLASKVAAVWRPRLDMLPALIDGGDLGRRLDPIERWLAFATVACDDAGDQVAGAARSWTRLVTALTGGFGTLDAYAAQEHLSQRTSGLAGFVLSTQTDPAAALTGLFDQLWMEREQARMGVRIPLGRSDVPADSVGSRIAVAVGARAVAHLAALGTEALACELWRAAFAALREMWLGTHDHTGHVRPLVAWVYACGGVACRAMPVTPTGPLHTELVDALRYVASDPHLACEVGESWLANAWPIEDVLACYGDAGMDLRLTCGALLDEPPACRDEHTAIATLGAALGLVVPRR